MGSINTILLSGTIVQYSLALKGYYLDSSMNELKLVTLSLLHR